MHLVFSRRHVGVEAQQEGIPLVEHWPVLLFHGNHDGDDDYYDDHYDDYYYDDYDDDVFLPKICYQVKLGHKLSNESNSQVIKWNWVTSYQMKVGHKLSSKPAMMLAIVDLPLPGGPLMKTCKIVALEYQINL